MIELPRGLLHLLPQKIECGESLSSRFISVKIDIVTDGVCWPKSMDAARRQQFLCGDLFEKFLRIVEKFAGLFADHRIIKYRRVAAAQFPDVKEGRPVDVVPKIDNRWTNWARAHEVRPRWLAGAPVYRRSICARFFQHQQFFPESLRRMLLAQLCVIATCFHGKL